MSPSPSQRTLGQRPNYLLSAVLGLSGLLFASASSAEDQKPHVEILESSGAIDGPGGGIQVTPRWERVRLDLEVVNRLSSNVHQLELQVSLVSAQTGAEGRRAPFAGWSFPNIVLEAEVPAGERSYHRIERELPPRRTSPPADEIAYKVELVSYRLSPPDLDNAIELLGSSHPSDQRAALKSFERIDSNSSEQVEEIGEQLALALATLPSTPGAAEALRMLFAVRAVGTLEDQSHLENLLYLPEQLDRVTWGKAVLDLALRMVAASEKDEPRLLVLPSWARSQTALLRVRAQDALEEAVRDAVLRLGDKSVAVLLWLAHTGETSEVRARAQGFLRTMGRSTIRSQLNLHDQTARLQVIQVMGRLGKTEVVPALVPLLGTRPKQLSQAAANAILSMKERAIPALVSALGKKNDRAVKKLLRTLAKEHQTALSKVARDQGLRHPGKLSLEALLDQLQGHLRQKHQAQLRMDVQRGLELGKERAYADAIPLLNRVYQESPAIYQEFAPEILELYLSRGRRLLTRGDYDAAIKTMSEALTVQKSAEAKKIIQTSHSALARGYIDLGKLTKAENHLKRAYLAKESISYQQLWTELRHAQAKYFYRQGEYALARKYLDHAQKLNPERSALAETNRRLMIAENLVVIGIVGFILLVSILAMILIVRRKNESKKIVQLTEKIDETTTPPQTI